MAPHKYIHVVGLLISYNMVMEVGGLHLLAHSQVSNTQEVRDYLSSFGSRLCHSWEDSQILYFPKDSALILIIISSASVRHLLFCREKP